MFPEAPVEIAKRIFRDNAAFGLACAENHYSMWQGGNQWSAYDSFLSFFRHVAQLNLPQYEAFQHWETLSLHSGPRIVHPDFCMISDRPQTLLVDDQNRPHCVDGPFCRWRDGSALYSVHGVRIPAWIIERPKTITVAKINAEQNQEIKRLMIEKRGWSWYLKAAKARTLDTRKNPVEGTVESLMTTNGERILVCACPSTGRVYSLEVPRDVSTCAAAQAYLSGGLSGRIVAAS